MECLARADHVSAVDIVSKLFRVIAEDLVGGADITKMTCFWRQCVTMFTVELSRLSEEEKSPVHGEGLCAQWIRGNAPRIF
jgi:hypothetical protein